MGVRFFCGDDTAMFYSGPAEVEERHPCPVSAFCSSDISWRILLLVKKALHRHRVGFEPQRASPFMKWVKAP
jgi:hypothetical protein